MRKIRFLVLVAMTLLFVSDAGTSAFAADRKLTNVVLVDPAYSLTFSASYLAEDLGIFKKNGLNVKPIVIHGVGATNAVISGSADFVEAAAASITRAAAKGRRLLIIAETSDRPTVQVVLRKTLADASGFQASWPLSKRAALLRGRVIAVDGVNSLVDAYLTVVAKRAGIASEAMHIALMAPPNMLAAFKAKQIDGFAMTAPWTLTPVIEGAGVLVASGPNGDPADYAPFANGVLATRPETCHERRSLCIAMGHSFVQAEAFLHDHPKRTLAIVGKRFPKLDRRVLAASLEIDREVSPSPPLITKNGLENAQRLSVDAGLLKPDQELASFDGLFTNQFVR
jgi:ABC-type nitrate/sulfonate/bicarbonate transport system substrate-binding protein